MVIYTNSPKVRTPQTDNGRADLLSQHNGQCVTCVPERKLRAAGDRQ